MSASNASALKSAPHSIRYRLFYLYRDHVPTKNKERFLAIIDDAPNGTPNAQWIMNSLDALDALLDPYRALPKEMRKGRGAIRGACMEVLMKQLRERIRHHATFNE
jgi:hypothetical protein